MPVDPVSSTFVHSSGTVVATCSGQRSIPNLGNDDSSESESDSEGDSEDENSPSHSAKPHWTPDNSIKVWSL